MLSETGFYQVQIESSEFSWLDLSLLIAFTRNSGLSRQSIYSLPPLLPFFDSSTRVGVSHFSSQSSRAAYLLSSTKSSGVAFLSRN